MESFNKGRNNPEYPVQNQQLPPLPSIAASHVYGFTNMNQGNNLNRYPPNDPYLQRGQPIQQTYEMNRIQQGSAGTLHQQQQQRRGAPVPRTGDINQWGDMSGFNEKVTRIKFIRKVYLILTSQLIFTFGVVAIFVFVEPVKKWAKTKTGYTLYVLSMVLFFGLIISFSIIMCCKPKIMRKTPFNFIFLGLITLTMSFMLGMISSYHTIQAVLIAVGITLVVTVGVTIFSMQTKLDFTNCWLVMLCLSLALLGFGIAAAATYRYLPILQAVYGGLGACLMAVFLAIDTQLLMGNKKYKFNEEDYINAALQLYLDICYIFIYILQAVGGASSK